ncbi:CopG family transcriptional regulator [Halomarina pelagica]|uniref:CopG family transcriptional regulator n=1 Tax=Halomarina pelagica TaxID=2961599 RepID=UPI0020C3E477|nr:CopG family transcriptional regulator [Halomarina sp. BND7]
MRRYTLLCEESLAREVESLAHEYGIRQEDVLRQLVVAGLESLDDGLDEASGIEADPGPDCG